MEQKEETHMRKLSEKLLYFKLGKKYAMDWTLVYIFLFWCGLGGVHQILKENLPFGS